MPSPKKARILRKKNKEDVVYGTLLVGENGHAMLIPDQAAPHEGVNPARVAPGSTGKPREEAQRVAWAPPPSSLSATELPNHATDLGHQHGHHGHTDKPDPELNHTDLGDPDGNHGNHGNRDLITLKVRP